MKPTNSNSHGNQEESVMSRRLTSRISAKTRQLGQGMSEYLIIVALIAVAAIGVVGFMGDTVSNQMAGMAQELAGTNAATAQRNATNNANQAATIAGQRKTLANYATANGQ